MPNSKFSPMVDNQIPIPNLNRIIDELMSDHCQGMEEVHLEPQSETMTNVEQENQPEMEELVEEERATKRQRVAERTEEGESEEDRDFVSTEEKDLWTKVLADKGFVRKRGFGKLISLFCRDYRKERLGELLCIYSAWIPCSSQGILCNHGGYERRYILRARSLGTLWAQKNQ